MAEGVVSPINNAVGSPTNDHQQAESSARVMPAAQRILAQENISASAVMPTGPGGRILKEDVERGVGATHFFRAGIKTIAAIYTATSAATSDFATRALAGRNCDIRFRPWSRIKRIIGSGNRRLSAGRRIRGHEPDSSPHRRTAGPSAASIRRGCFTTFNEVDMGEVMALRVKHREQYEKHYGVKLGFMSFFVKAVVDALKSVPQLNAEVREPHVVYRNYYDIGIAVGGGQGFGRAGAAERRIHEFCRNRTEGCGFCPPRRGKQTQAGRTARRHLHHFQRRRLRLDALHANHQSAAKRHSSRLHAIQDRPVARNGEVVVRPMMYLALTYDHRIVDGREAVMFLKRIKEVIEEPSRILLEI